MKKGSAAIWADIHRQQGLTTLSFGTFTQFQTNFETMFVDTNVTREAMNWLSTTCIDSGEQLQEYINTFKLNIVHTKYDELKDTATLISYFSAGVPTWIMHRIQAMDTVPTTLTLWYEKAAHFRLQKEIAQKIALMHRGNRPQLPRTNQSFHSLNPRPFRDPNAMDIDALNLSPVEQSCCLRGRLCFICKQLNSSTRNHPRKTTTREVTTTRPTRNPEQV